VLEPRRLVLDIPARTFIKILLTIAVVWCLLQLASIILLLIVAVILAVALDEPVSWIERRGLSRAPATLLVSGAILVATVAFLYLTWSSLANQWQFLQQQLNSLASELIQYVPPWFLPSEQNGDWRTAVQPFLLNTGRSLVTAATLIVLGFFVTIYLLIDGRSTLAWVVAFIPLRWRDRVAQTVEQSREMIVAYAAGNVITSLFAAAWVLVSMMALHVPAALLLAVIAGLADFVPVLGFIASAIPAIALSLTVSPHTAVITIGLWLVYHGIENYLIAPWAYGRRLRLSDLAVILAFVIGAELAGVIGALIALPIAALYPTIERIWLREQLPRETVAEHRALSS
jgi:predicted PurR-regulated permease PerM